MALAAHPVVGETPAQPRIVDTLGARVQVRRNEGATAKPHAQLVFFARFPAPTGVFKRWVSTAR